MSFFFFCSLWKAIKQWTLCSPPCQYSDSPPLSTHNYLIPISFCLFKYMQIEVAANELAFPSLSRALKCGPAALYLLFCHYFILQSKSVCFSRVIHGRGINLTRVVISDFADTDGAVYLSRVNKKNYKSVPVRAGRRRMSLIIDVKRGWNSHQSSAVLISLYLM